MPIHSFLDCPLRHFPYHVVLGAWGSGARPLGRATLPLIESTGRAQGIGGPAHHSRHCWSPLTGRLPSVLPLQRFLPLLLRMDVPVPRHLHEMAMGSERCKASTAWGGRGGGGGGSRHLVIHAPAPGEARPLGGGLWLLLWGPVGSKQGHQLSKKRRPLLHWRAQGQARPCGRPSALTPRHRTRIRTPPPPTP